MNNHLLSQFFNVDEEQLLAAAESFAAAGPQIWPASNPVYVKMEDSGDDASSNASSWGFPATSTTPMDYDDAPATINCIPGGLAQISLPGSSRSPSPDMTLTLPGGFNFAAASQQQKPVSALPAHLRPREMALNPSSLVSPSVIPTPLQQQQQQQSSPTETQASNSKSNGRKLNSTSSADPSPAPSSFDAELSGQPHPYSISPSNTTALFTRASSVSSNTSGPTKKGRAPPSGPISTKDFVPPDVSGLSKREARLVKNRAAAFLSRQRKREEFEGLEARVEVLETDNARLYKELEAYRSGGSSSTATAAAAAPAIAQAGATPAALQAELVGLRRQLGARDQELAKLHGRMQALNAEANAERERAAQKEAEIAQLKRQLASRGVAAAAPAPSTEDSDSDSEDAQSTTDAVSGKKDLKSAGSMAFMVLLFSLSSLLTSAESSGSAKPPVASERVRRPGMHHRDSSRTYLDLPQQAFSSGLAYDTFLSTSDMMLSPSFGFDEDNLLGGSSAFAGLTSASTPSPTRQPQQQQQKKKTQDNHVADSLASAISGVKSITPEEFEFDFTVPSTSSSSLDCFTFPARPQQQQAGKKIRVCVKSALPLNLNLDALSKAASTSVAGAASQKAKENDVLTSSFGYRVPETDDLLGDSGFWSAAASTFGGSSSPSSVLSPTMSTASGESRKRKRVVVEINPRGASRRRLSEETNDGDDEMDTWDVKFSEDDDLALGGASFDEDVQMRL